MLRVLCVMLLAGACVAHAGERYREVWNPPEAGHARHTRHVASHKPAAATCQLAAKRSAKAKPSRVAVSTRKPTKRQRVAHAEPVNAASHAWNRPPVYTPEGNVLRVDSNGAKPNITR
ncbi:hypothetical protein [Trinickia sp.]|uniref:hypothetical protein n=1 Tax=Trinickia sp. TaxID=2571163 RepID=UPI003F7E65D9